MSMYDYYQRPPRRSPAAVLWPLVLLVIAGLFLVWRFWPHDGSGLNPQARERAVTPSAQLADAAEAATKLYPNAAPSVVNVTNLAVRRDRFSLNLQQIHKGTASGFVWYTDGHIVTNYHVIQGAGALRVTLADHSAWD